MKFLIMLPIVAMASCSQSATTQSADNKALAATEYTCASATASLKTAILFNDKLSPATRANITRAGRVLDTVCSQDMPPTLDTTAQRALDGALSLLSAAAAEAQR